MLHKDLNDEVDLKYFIEHTKDLDMLRKQNFALIFLKVYKVVQKELAKQIEHTKLKKAGYNEFLFSSGKKKKKKKKGSQNGLHTSAFAQMNSTDERGTIFKEDGTSRRQCKNR